MSPPKPVVAAAPAARLLAMMTGPTTVAPPDNISEDVSAPSRVFFDCPVMVFLNSLHFDAAKPIISSCSSFLLCLISSESSSSLPSGFLSAHDV